MGLKTSPMTEKFRPISERLEIRHEEDRTQKEFRSEMEYWIQQVRKAFPEAVRALIAFTQTPARFTVHNRRGRFLEDVEVVLHIEGPVIQYRRPYDENSIFDRLPARPRKWGPWIENRDYGTLRPLSPSTYRPAKPNTTNFRNSGSVNATLSCKWLRPWRSHTFTRADDHDDLVLLTQDLDLSAVHITATATARGIDSNCVTEFTHLVADPIGR